MSFSEFYQRSINEPEQFWAEQARRIDWQTPFTQTLDHSNPPFARWFCEGRTNLCHNAPSIVVYKLYFFGFLQCK